MDSKLSAGKVFPTGLHKFVWSHRKLKLQTDARCYSQFTTCSTPLPKVQPGSNLCPKWKLPQKEQWKVTNTTRTRFRGVGCWALKPTHQEMLPLFGSTQSHQHNQGLLLPLVVAILQLGKIPDCCHCRELQKLKPAFPFPTKLTGFWASLSPHTISCFLSSPSRSSLI